MISRPSRHLAFDAKHTLLCLLSALALVAAFGVEDAHGIQVSDGGVNEDVAVVSRPRASRDRGPLSGAMSLDGDSNSTAVAMAETSEVQGEREVSLCLLLIVRDEEASLRANLPLWVEVADCFVIGIDDRTTDDTPHVIQQVLGDDHPRFIFFYTFDCFAQARNVVLRSTAHNFPDATHVIVADADWRPNLATVDKSELDFVHGSFPFLVHDHTGHTARMVGWLLRFDEGVRFKYRVHEVLDTTASVEGASPRGSKFVGWEVQVVESDSNWSAKVHQHSRSSERYLFDLHLLELDYEDDPTDLHTLFYLGITKFAYLESLTGKGTHQKTPELEALVASGMSYFRQAVDLHGGTENSEYVWGSKRWLAYGYHYFVGDTVEAKAMYEDCIAYDPARVDCVAFLGRLHLDSGDLDSAWTMAKATLLHRSPAGRVLNYFYVFECFVPTQAATVIFKRISASGPGGLGNDSLEGLLTTGWYLLRHHRDQCNRGVMVDSPEDIDRLESWFQETIAREGVDVEEIKRLALLTEEEDLLAVLLRTWGTGSKASAVWTLQAKQKQQEKAQQQQQQQQQQGKEEGTDDKYPRQPSPAEVAGSTNKPAQELAEIARRSDHAGGNQRQKEPASGDAGGGAPDATGKHITSRRGSITVESCEKIAAEARARLRLDGEVVAGALTATSLVQIGAGSEQERDYFRALVFGGGGGEGRARGLEHEELLQVVSLLLQLSASSRRSEFTYAHPDPAVVEAARSAVSSCANELGITGGNIKLDFVRSTMADFLRRTTAIDRQFDYVDVGGPLSLRSERGMKRNVGSASATPSALDTDASVLDSETLKVLGQKLAPGAHLRAWAFAANPSTELAFRAAKKTGAGYEKTVRDIDARSTPAIQQERGGPRETSDSLVGKILREMFQIGQTRAPGNESVLEITTPRPVQAGFTAEEEAWTRQVLAGGDRLTVSDVVDVLADGGFELALVLGKNAAERGEAAGARAEHIGELLEAGLSRWEIADFVDSLDPKTTPALLHQVVAVPRDRDPIQAV